mgnify:CR=1 FL=1
MPTHIAPRLLLIAAIAVPLFAACGDDDEAAPLDPAALEGRTFVATDFTPDGIVDGSEITVVFDDGAVVVTAGCNTQRGGFSIDDSVLNVEAMASTMMACDEALMNQDAALAALMSSSPTVELDDDTLTVMSGDTQLVLVES